MKMFHIISVLAVLAFASGAHAAIVFSDDFNDPDGTAIDGKAADVGGPWEDTSGSNPTVSGGIYDTSGAGRGSFAFFTTALGAGEIITVVYDAAESAGSFATGFAGVSLFIGGAEEVFLGNPGAIEDWGIDGGTIGSTIGTGQSAEDVTATFTYAYDTGDWTFSLSTGENLAGTGVAGQAFNRVRIANGEGGDLAVDSLEISIVPEPASLALMGIGGLFMFRRRR